MTVVGAVLSLYDFKWEITLGDIALGVLAGLISVAVTIYRFWLPRCPFSMRFYEKPWDTQDEENPSQNWKSLHCEKGKPQKFLLV